MGSGVVVRTGASSTSYIRWFYKNVQRKKTHHSFLLRALTLPKLNAELRWLCTLFFARLTFNTVVSGPLILAEILRGKYPI